MLLEEYLDKGILFEMVLKKSKIVPITFNNGQIIIRDVVLGVEGCDYTFDLIERALE